MYVCYPSYTINIPGGSNNTIDWGGRLKQISETIRNSNSQINDKLKSSFNQLKDQMGDIKREIPEEWISGGARQSLATRHSSFLFNLTAKEEKPEDMLE
jgi:hypothetical protein